MFWELCCILKEFLVFISRRCIGNVLDLIGNR